MTHLFGERVRALRQTRGLRVADVAAAAGITASQLSRIERGLITADDALIRQLAASLDRSCEDELLLLAGRLPPDLQAILQTHPAESALLLREHFGTARAAATPAAGVPVVPAQLVTAIAQWAIRTADDVVLDPSCGDGAFVAAAAARLIELGSTPTAALNQIHGYDADTEACARATRRLREVTGSASRQIQRLDFLRVESPARLPFHRSGPPAVTVVLGAIDSTEPARHQRATTATARAHARRVAAEAGIALPDTAPPWAALVVHAASFVRPGGRLALIVPAAMVHAHYAADVRSYVAQLFPALTVATFARPLPGFGEVAALLGDAAGDAGVRTRRVNDAAELTAALATSDDDNARVAEPASLRWSGASLPTPGRALLRELQRDGVLRRLGDLVRIDSGIVSGANHFFQLTAARAAGIDPAFLRPLLPTANANPGLIVRTTDWQAWRDAGKPSFLLTIPPAAKLNRATRAYLDDGERQGLPVRATCRRRPVWYALPRTPAPAALLTYLCGRLPRMLLNDASVTHVNALHSVRPRAGVNTAAVAASFLNTAALLGCELLGRHMGNGVLKLEPAEVENLLVAYPPHLDDGDRALLDEADALWRAGRADDAIALGDRTVLREALGVEVQVMDKLRRCYENERDRRCAPARVRTAALNEVEI